MSSLIVKNLHEINANPFPYIIAIIPRPLLEELIKSEHFVIADLLKSIPSSSSQAVSTQESEVEIAQGALVSFVRPDQSRLVVHDLKLAPQVGKKRKEKKGKKVGQVKVFVARLEGFLDWANSVPPS